MKFNALDVSYYCGLVHGWKSLAADAETEQKLRVLTSVMDRLSDQGDDNYHSVWVKAKRPTFRQYYNRYFGYECPYKEADENEIKKARDDYAADYPYAWVWFQLATKHFTRSEREDFYAFFIDDKYVFSVNDCNKSDIFNGTDLLDWAIAEAENVVRAVNAGTYQDELQKIPYIYRYGNIERRVYWELMPEEKKRFLSAYSMREVKKFIRDFGNEKICGRPLPHMTARIFYEACAVIYKALKRKRDGGLYRYTETEEERERYSGTAQTPKEMYFANADGRDDGLKNVPMDDAQAFEEWDDRKGPYYEFNGSHPWEIITSFSLSLSMHLFPKGSADEGYYFALSGKSDVRAPETVIAANALVKSGYPVMVCGFDIIKDRIEGTDSLDVVPPYVFSISDNDIHLPEGKDGIAVAKHVSWTFDEYKMK